MTLTVTRLAAAALLLVATASTAETQQTNPGPRIGFLSAGSSSDRMTELRRDAFLKGLRDLGYVDGKNITIEYRWAAGNMDRVPALAEQLVRLKVDIIVASATPVIQAAKNATTTIPIVMMGAADPVATGLVASLSRPGGNITGMSNMMPELAGKRVELLRQVVPKLSRVAFLGYANDPANRLFESEARAAVERLGMQFQPAVIAGPEELEGAFSSIVKNRSGALIVMPLFVTNLGQAPRIADLAKRHQLPTITDATEFAEAGGLMSYGPDLIAQWRHAAGYVDKILKGAKPADLPVEQPRKFQLVINLKAAKALSLTIPQSLLLRADHVIE